MGDFNRSVAESTPRAERGTVVRVEKTPLSLELGKIVKDKDEVRIKDILDEMNNMAVVAQVGTVNENTSAGKNEGLKNTFDKMKSIFDLIKDLVNKIGKGNKKKKQDPKPEDKPEEEISSVLEMGKAILDIVDSVPKLTSDPEVDVSLLIRVANYLKSKITESSDPFDEFLLDTSDLFIELDAYLDREFSKEEKVSIIHRLKIQEFFDDFKAKTSSYCKLAAPILSKISSDIKQSLGGIQNRVMETDRNIETAVNIEKDNAAYNRELMKRREEYKAHVIEQELNALEPNPTEERIIYQSDYSKHLELLRKETTGD